MFAAMSFMTEPLSQASPTMTILPVFFTDSMTFV